MARQMNPTLKRVSTTISRMGLGAGKQWETDSKWVTMVNPNKNHENQTKGEKYAQKITYMSGRKRLNSLELG